MSTISVELTTAEHKAFEYIALDPSEWVSNFAKDRARQACDEVIAKLIHHCNENSIALVVGRDAQVEQAFELGIVKALKDIPEPTFPEPIDPITNGE